MLSQGRIFAKGREPNAGKTAVAGKFGTFRLINFLFLILSMYCQSAQVPFVYFIRYIEKVSNVELEITFYCWQA